MAPDKTIQFAEAFCDVLNGLMPGWDTEAGVIRGPDGAVIRFSERHSAGSDGHADLEFSFRDNDPQTFRLWDCVSGFGATLSECARSAARLWGATSAGALLELRYSRRGEFADHFHGNEPQGLVGWHCICGAVIGYGQGDSPQSLQDWWLSRHAVLPTISPFLRTLADDRPHSIKVFFGAQDVAEVRVDGDIHEEASAALLSLDWPRLEPVGYIRVFVIALHRE